MVDRKNFLKAKIKMALLSAEVTGVQSAMGTITSSQAEKQISVQVEALYKVISSLEYSHESEVM